MGWTISEKCVLNKTMCNWNSSFLEEDFFLKHQSLQSDHKTQVCIISWNYGFANPDVDSAFISPNDCKIDSLRQFLGLHTYII